MQQQANPFSHYDRLLRLNPALHNIATYKRMIQDQKALGMAFYDYATEAVHDQ